MSTILGRVTVAVAVAALVAMSARCSLAQAYRLTDLGTLGGTSSLASGINDRGQVVGVSLLPANIEQHAFLYDPGPGFYSGVMTNLNTVGSSESAATAINDAGQVVGFFYGSNHFGTHAFIYDDGAMKELPVSLGGVDTSAYAINDAGQIVGSADTSGTTNPHAFLYDPGNGGSVTDLAAFGGPYRYGEAINDAGQVTGSGGDRDRAFLYHNGVGKDLGTLGGGTSWALGINNHGQVVGYSKIAPDISSPYHAFLYDGSAMFDLGTLGDAAELSQALAINDRGQVVGRSTVNGSSTLYGHAFLYQNGVMGDLNDLIDPALGWMLTEATGINSRGQIIANGVPQGDTTFHAFLLTPTAPEPGALPLTLCGLGVFGAIRRRRRKPVWQEYDAPTAKR